MSRFDQLKRLDKKSRNRLRAILSDKEGNAIGKLAKLRGKLSKNQSDALDAILNSPYLGKAVRTSSQFPKQPPFDDTLQSHIKVELDKILDVIETNVSNHKQQLNELANYLRRIDAEYAASNIMSCRNLVTEAITHYGWSHAILRRIVLIRENLPKGEEDDQIEKLIQLAGIKKVAVASLIHSYSRDQSLLTIKRSILNIPDRGAINRYSRAISRITAQPFASCRDDLAAFLLEVEKCSLIDAVIIAKFNSHLFTVADYPAIEEFSKHLGCNQLFEQLVSTYDATDSESEYVFYKQSSVWLEYEPIHYYRLLLDNFYDTSRDELDYLTPQLLQKVNNWVGGATISDLVGQAGFTKHQFKALTKLEVSGTSTRSAIFNYWLYLTEGQIGFDKKDLLTLMGLTRDLARTIPIKATRTAAKLAKDELVKLILFLLLGKRSNNELDSFLLRKLLEDIAFRNHEGSLVKLVKSYETTHPYVAEYIYEIATEDFLAKLNKIAPHRADIPEIRASLHEWMASFVKFDQDHYLQRARNVRIDHQLNRVRNEIDDHRIYVDPSRFSSWFEDEMMIELNGALTSTGSGKKGIAVNCDETILSLIVRQCYSAFCSNSVFGIASYIGRRIRHGTFHGHLYSSVINSIEKNEKYEPLFRTSQFNTKWVMWKDIYNKTVEEIIQNRLHVYSKSKPLGLLQPESYSSVKLEILSAAVKNISNNYIDTTSVAGIDQTIIDYCWRLAEVDLITVTRYLKAQQSSLKNLSFLQAEVLSAISPINHKLADAFYRDLEKSIDLKLAKMFGWFKRPSIVAAKASVSLLFDATVAEVKDTIPDFNPQGEDCSVDEIELVGGVYHLVYDSLAVVVANAARHGDHNRPVKRKFEIKQDKEKRLIVEISSSIKPSDNPQKISADIEMRKRADFHDANLYQGKSGISKLMQMAHERDDFFLEQYEVVGNEVKVKLAYILEH